MSDWHRLLAFEFLGSDPLQWALATLAFIVTFTVLPLVRGYVQSRRRRWAAGSVPRGIELAATLISSTSRIFLWVLAIEAGASLLDTTPRVDEVLRYVLIVSFWLQVGAWALIAVRFFLDGQQAKAAPGDPLRLGSLEIILFLARLVIFSLVFLLALDNLGVNISALLAGLGIGGIAIALAVQTVLSDLFASLSIALDKPFEIGDALQVDSLSGTVERIGIKSTRLRATSGEQIIISNADLLKSRVHNHKTLQERRHAFTVAIVYDTPVAAVREVPGIIERAIREHEPRVRFDRSHFAKLAEKSLVFEAVYFVLSPDYALFMDIQQAINLRLLTEFEERGIPFAFYTQTLPLKAPDEAGATGSATTSAASP